ncbi:MAG: GNAT family N-acetyltransferase [Clostridia bacterium]|nr:GNAT family N-acetyltransferase [Clostridia bacterium]
MIESTYTHVIVEEGENEMIVTFAQDRDISILINLVKIVQDEFPGLVMEDYIKFLKNSIREKTAIIAKEKNIVYGVLLFSYDNREISFLAVNPKYRKKRVATILIKKMLNQFPKGVEITVTTYRENDPKGTAARALYKSLGFKEGELLIEFDYPTQKFILNS